MYCRYCGKEIPEGTLICPECGKNLEEDFTTLPTLENRVQEKIETVPPVQHHRLIPDLKREIGDENYYRVKKVYKRLLNVEKLEIGAISLSLISLILGVLSESATYLGIGLIISSFIILIAYVMQIFTLWDAQDLNTNLKHAFTIVIIGLIISIINGIGILGDGYLGNVFSMLSNVLSFLVIITIANSIEDFANVDGDEELARQAQSTAKLNTILAVIVGIFALVTIDISNSAIITLADLIAYIKYFILLKDTTISL